MLPVWPQKGGSLSAHGRDALVVAAQFSMVPARPRKGSLWSAQGCDALVEAAQVLYGTVAAVKRAAPCRLMAVMILK